MRYFFATFLFAVFVGSFFLPYVVRAEEGSCVCDIRMRSMDLVENDCDVSFETVTPLGSNTTILQLLQNAPTEGCQDKQAVLQDLSLGAVSYMPGNNPVDINASLTFDVQTCTNFGGTNGSTNISRFIFGGCDADAVSEEDGGNVSGQPSNGGANGGGSGGNSGGNSSGGAGSATGNSSGGGNSGGGGALPSSAGYITLDNPIQTGTDIPTIIGRLVGQALTLVGSVTFLVFIVGGAFWLTSAGNPDRVKMGFNTMIYAVIGLFVIFGSYAILNTVLGGIGVQGIEPLEDGGSGAPVGIVPPPSSGYDCAAISALAAQNNQSSGTALSLSCVEPANCDNSDTSTAFVKGALEAAKAQASAAGVQVKNLNGQRDITRSGHVLNFACPTSAGNSGTSKCCVPKQAEPAPPPAPPEPPKDCASFENHYCLPTLLCDSASIETNTDCTARATSCCAVTQEDIANRRRRVQACIDRNRMPSYLGSRECQGTADKTWVANAYAGNQAIWCCNLPTN